MRGIDGTARLVAATIGAHVDDRLARLASELGPPPPNGIAVSPKLVHWAQLEPAAVAFDHWPFVMVVPARTVEFRYADRAPDGTEVYDVRYLLQVLSYVRGEGYDEVAGARGRLALGVREVLLAYPKLAAGTRIESPSLTEDYSAVGELENSSVAAVLMTLIVACQERLSPPVPPYGTVLTTEVDVTAGDP